MISPKTHICTGSGSEYFNFRKAVPRHEGEEEEEEEEEEESERI